ncbi:MAG: TIGR03000 domain-containing protein, partial [Planctomycetia bacterium]|nr:TIGR03000 domain-containing protein [Planctomycetia bacterium]
SYGGSSGGGGSYGSYGSYGGYGPAAVYTSGYSSYPAGSVIGGEQIISESPAYGSGSVIESVPNSSAPIIDSSSVEPAVPADGAMLVVRLPADAEVFVNGAKTAATGSLRRYMSRGLAAGREYDFVVKVVTKRDGEPREETKVAALAAGGRSNLDFTVATARTAKKTSLTLRVPADAKVWLAGNVTVSQGDVRVFETDQLKDGQAWRNYEIRVATLVGGREQVASKTIDLIGGSTVELEIDPAQRTAAAEATAALR